MAKSLFLGLLDGSIRMCSFVCFVWDFILFFVFFSKVYKFNKKTKIVKP
jgi:hypothetical protein